MKQIITPTNLAISLTVYSLTLLNTSVAKGQTAAIEQQRENISTAVEALAPTFPTDSADLPTIFSTLTTHVGNTPDAFGAAFAFNPDILVSSPFVFRGSSGLEQIDIADNLGSGYTDTVWYSVPVEQGEALWSVPYFDVGGAGENVILTTYSKPLYNEPASGLSGVLTSDLLLATVNSTDLTNQMTQVETALDALAPTFPTDSGDLPAIFNTLTTHVQNNPDVFGAAFALNPDTLVSSPFVFRGSSGLEQIDIADNLGSGYTEAVWYSVPVEQGVPVWSRPYFDVGGAGESVLLTTYSIPIFDPNDSSLVGVLTSDIVLAELGESSSVSVPEPTSIFGFLALGTLGIISNLKRKSLD